MSGVAIATSKSIQPSLILSASSLPPTKSAPGLLGDGDVGPLAEHKDALRLPDSVRQHDRPADDLVGLLGVDPQTHCNFYRLIELGRLNRLRKPGLQAFERLDGRRDVGGRSAFNVFAKCFCRLDCLAIVICLPPSESTQCLTRFSVAATLPASLPSRFSPPRPA